MHFQYCQEDRADQAEVFGPSYNTELPLPTVLKPEALALGCLRLLLDQDSMLTRVNTIQMPLRNALHLVKCWRNCIRPYCV